MLNHPTCRPLRVVNPRLLAIAFCTLSLGCADDGNGVVDPMSGDPALFSWNLPAGVIPPPVPADNPMSAAKVELGRRLFYDTRLSVNGAFSCASCHRQDNAFADAKNIPLGTTGEAHTRNSMGLTNIGYQRTFGWAGPATVSLEDQALIPMFGEVPIELGLKGREADVMTRLRAEPVYRDLFPKSFPGSADPYTVPNVTRAIAAFERTMLSFEAPIDRFRAGDTLALSAAARRGQNLFNARRCNDCHGGTLLGGTAAVPTFGSPVEFANTGLYNVNGTGAYPARNGGLFESTGRPGDQGRMKVPSLRNVALTFPYGHDGSVGSLGEVLDNYARGGRVVLSGPNAGDGRVNPFKDRRINGFPMPPQDRQDLLAFLASLTDSAFVRSARFSNPWR